VKKGKWGPGNVIETHEHAREFINNSRTLYRARRSVIELPHEHARQINRLNRRLDRFPRAGMDCDKAAALISVV